MTSDQGWQAWTLQVDAHPTFPVLFPVSDLLNHSPKAKMTWCKERTCLTFILEEPVMPGKRLYNNYGQKSNEQCKLDSSPKTSV